MTWTRFFWTMIALVAGVAGYFALVHYGAPEWLGRVNLYLMASYFFFVSSVGLVFTAIVSAVRERWWSRPMRGRIVRRRLGTATYLVFWGVLILGWAAYLAVFMRYQAIEPEFPSSELDQLFRAMSSVSLTALFACLYIMIRFSRYVYHVGPDADGDRPS